MKKHPKKFKVGLIQLAFSKNPDDNLKKALVWIEKAAKSSLYLHIVVSSGIESVLLRSKNL